MYRQMTLWPEPEAPENGDLAKTRSQHPKSAHQDPRKGYTQSDLPKKPS